MHDVINKERVNSSVDGGLFSLRQIRTIAIIAEGIPENLTRKLIKTADQKGVTIIGPATVGASRSLTRAVTSPSPLRNEWRGTGA